jgi:bifunctional non-homologous end joining protein LigD
VDSATKGNCWLFELKFDGSRCPISTGDGCFRALIRAGLDWTDNFNPIPEAANALPSRPVLNHCKVVVIYADGRTIFQALQSAMKTEPPRLEFYAFYLFRLNDEDLTSIPERPESLNQAPFPGFTNSQKMARTRSSETDRGND